MIKRRLPAEWEPVESVLLTWPHKSTDWRIMLAEVERFYISLAEKIRQHAKLVIACGDPSILKELKDLLSNQVAPYPFEIYSIPSNDTWARDHGPITVLQTGSESNALCYLDFQFNGWGNKFDWEKDNQISQSLYTDNALPPGSIERQDWVLEGGSIESDGEGTLLTTSQCLLNLNRNPSLNRTEIESRLKSSLGIERILWLNNGHLEGDDTDAHIDTLARFCDPQTICYVQCSDPRDPHYASLSAMEEELLSFRTFKGEEYRLIPLPMVSPMYDEDGERLPATYANFLICNDAVLFPIYGQIEDELAINQIKVAMPNHNIVPIDCSVLVQQNGSLHCITMQLPKP